MAFLYFIGALVLALVSWAIWVIIAVGAALILAFGLWFLWDGIMRLTYYNFVNLVAKVPSFIGNILGFVFTLPAAAVSLGISIWTGAQGILIALLTFRGDPNTEFCKTFGENFIQNSGDGIAKFHILQFYYEHCQWIWGGAGFMHSYFPWQCGLGDGALFSSGAVLPVPAMIIKLFLLGLPYMALFVIPIAPIIWSLVRPIVGAMSRLPAISGNGDGRD